MIKVEAMLDELSIGHENRIGWINGCRTPKEIASLIRETLTEQGYEVSTLSRLHQLALVSDKDPFEYVRLHSMLAVLRVAAKGGVNMPHYADNVHEFAPRLGMLTPRSGGYCCIKCIEDDLQNRNFSWYRRKHHLIGVDWCLEHGCSLSKVDSAVPFTQCPHLWLSENRLVPVNACEPNLPEEGFLRRYVEVATKLLERDRPFQVENVSLCLAKRAEQYNLRIGRLGKRPLISDRLFEIAPNDWLKQHLSAFDTKIPLVYFNRIDLLALYKQSPGLGDAYVMAIAVLYESVEEALFDLSSMNEVGLVSKGKGSKKRPSRRGAQFWEGNIWSEYLEANGMHSEMANRLNIERGYLGRRLSDLGLPTLRGIDTSPVWRAFLRFMEGEEFAKSCALENIDQAELETQLRNCSRRVYKAVQKILSKPLNQRRTKPLT